VSENHNIRVSISFEFEQSIVGKVLIVFGVLALISTNIIVLLVILCSMQH
jgi:hypothetical protein